MDLLVLQEDKWVVCAPVDVIDGRKSCPFEDQLGDLFAGNFKATAKGFVARFAQFAKEGPRMPRESFHEVDKSEGIYEFVKCGHRVFCFLSDAGALVICSHIGIKKSQKVNQRDVDEAVRLKKLYQAAGKTRLVRSINDDK